MKQVDTAHYSANQPTGQRFQATVQETWAVWTRLLNEEFLKGVFSVADDARAFAEKVRRSGQSAEVRKTWVVVNETAGEAYAISGNGTKPLEGVDLDFSHQTRVSSLRKELMSRLSDEELLALGFKRG
jgi:hypothetical protein